MRVRKRKVIVEFVGCQYSWDGLPSLTPLAFFFQKNDTLVQSHCN